MKKIILNKKGFTMLELLMVIIVIGILASIGIPEYEMFMERSRIAEAIRAVSAIKIETDHRMLAGNTPADIVGDSNNIVTTLGLRQDFLNGNIPDVRWGYAVWWNGPTNFGEDYTIIATREELERPASSPLIAVIYYIRNNEIIEVDTWPL